MSVLKLAAQPRTLTGRKVRQLRQKGWVPVVVYGNKLSPVNLQVEARELDRTLYHGGTSQLVEVEVNNGNQHNVLIREIQRHPINNGFLHADFYAVDMTQEQEVSVTVYPKGEPEALDTGLMMLQALDTVTIRALPRAIPAYVEVDVTGLDLDTTITVADLPAIEGVEYVDDPEEAVFSMITTRAEEELEELEEGVEEGEEMAEPELVGEEGEEGEAEEGGEEEAEE